MEKNPQRCTFSYNIPCDCHRGYVRRTGRPLSRRKNKYILQEGFLGKYKLAQHTCEEDYRMNWSEAIILKLKQTTGTGNIRKWHPLLVGHHTSSSWTHRPTASQNKSISPMSIPSRGNASIQQGRRVW